MFEDRLDHDQCTRLVKRLSQTNFPFMCAHGRPSLVPLIAIGEGRAEGRRKLDWSMWKTKYTMH